MFFAVTKRIFFELNQNRQKSKSSENYTSLQWLFVIVITYFNAAFCF